MKCIYDPSYAEGWLHPKYTSRCIYLLTVRRDGQPSQSRYKRTDWLCVGFCYSLLDPGTLNNPVPLTVALVNLWHIMAGIYLRVFTFFFYLRVSCALTLFCPVGSSLLRLTMNGGFFGAVFPTGTVYGSVTIGVSLESLVDLLIQ